MSKADNGKSSKAEPTPAAKVAAAHQRQLDKLLSRFKDEMKHNEWQPQRDQYGTLMFWVHSHGRIVEHNRAWEYWLVSGNTPTRTTVGAL